MKRKNSEKLASEFGETSVKYRAKEARRAIMAFAFLIENEKNTEKREMSGDARENRNQRKESEKDRRE
jgi:hypothetical protein